MNPDYGNVLEGPFFRDFLSGMVCICLERLGYVTEHCEIWPFQYVRLLRKCVGNVYLSSSVKHKE